MSRRKSFWVFHLTALVLCVLWIGLFFLFSRLRAAGLPVVTCPLHDIFKIYCPLCGGSRTILSLISLMIPTPWRG